MYLFAFLVIVRTCTMLNSSGKSEHAFIVPDLRGKALFFKIKSDAGCRFLLFVILFMNLFLVYWSVFCFVSQMGVEFCQMVFSEFWYPMVDYIDWVSKTEPILQIWYQSLIKWVENLSSIFWERLYKLILWMFCKFSSEIVWTWRYLFWNYFNYKFNLQLFMFIQILYFILA